MNSNKKLLITGGTGSFGYIVLNRFLKTDHFCEIRIFSRDEKKQDDMRKAINNPIVKFYIGDVRDQRSVNEVVKGVDYSEESSILNFPAISLRQSMERPEAQDAGTIILTEFEPQIVLDSIKITIEEHNQRKYISTPQEYTVSDTSWRVLNLILGNSNLSNLWWGITK